MSEIHLRNDARIRETTSGNILFSAENFRRTRDALLSDGIALVRGFPEDPNAMLKVGRKLGSLEIVRPPEHRLAGFDEIRLQSTVRGKGIQGGGTYWHADSPWYEPPAAATLLYCELAPKSGGRTLFVDMRQFLSSLSDQMRILVSEAIGHYPCYDVLKAEHDAMGIADKELMAQMANIQRPLVRKHPKTGEEALYLNEKWLRDIISADGRSIRLASELYAGMDQSSHLKFHEWMQGDLLIWDNTHVAHKALQIASGSDKTTRRVVVRQYH